MGRLYYAFLINLIVPPTVNTNNKCAIGRRRTKWDERKLKIWRQRRRREKIARNEWWEGDDGHQPMETATTLTAITAQRQQQQQPQQKREFLRWMFMSFEYESTGGREVLVVNVKTYEIEYLSRTHFLRTNSESFIIYHCHRMGNRSVHIRHINFPNSWIFHLPFEWEWAGWVREGEKRECVHAAIRPGICTHFIEN